jgi:hypothetical protein
VAFASWQSWHRSRASNGPVEAINSLATRVKRVSFGLTNWTHWRVRVLLYAGKPDWSKPATITPVAPCELPKSLDKWSQSYRRTGTIAPARSWATTQPSQWRTRRYRARSYASNATYVHEQTLRNWRPSTVRIYWFWPHPHAIVSRLALATLRGGDSLTVQALRSFRGVSFPDIEEYEIVRDLPDPTIKPTSWMRRLVPRRPRLSISRSVARRRLLRGRRFDIAHIENVFYQADWLDLPMIGRRQPTVSMIHDVKPHRMARFSRAEYTMLKHLYRRSGHLIVYHKVLRDELTAEFGVHESKVHVMPIPLDSKLRPESAPRGTGDVKLLLFGSLRGNKGIEILGLRHLRAMLVDQPRPHPMGRVPLLLGHLVAMSSSSQRRIVAFHGPNAGETRSGHFRGGGTDDAIA